MKDAAREEKRILGPLVGGKLLHLPCNFSHHASVTEHIVDFDHVAFITRPSLSNNFIGYFGWRRTFSSSNVEADTFHWVRTSKLKRSPVAIEDDILLDKSNMMGTRRRG
jgi:hypothetical protein